jgi:hypothetical protein
MASIITELMHLVLSPVSCSLHMTGFQTQEAENTFIQAQEKKFGFFE